MKRITCCYVILIASCIAGSTQAEKSLWGDIDQPDANKAVNVQVNMPHNGMPVPGTPAAPGTPATPPAAPVVPQKTTCDVLAESQKLDVTVLKSAAIQDALRNNSQFVPAQYKSLITTQDSLNALYALYRKQYIFTYCR